LRDWSEGGAYVHNLMTGRIISRPEPRRSTPYHQAHSTALAGLDSTTGGDNRFYNNIFVGSGGRPAAGAPADADPLRFGGHGLWLYDQREFPLETGGNVYLHGARPYYQEKGALRIPETDPGVQLAEQGERVYLRLNLGADVRKASTRLVTTELLGRAKVSGLPYENADGSPLDVDTDYLGKKRSAASPFAGEGQLQLKVW
jgi:hypothetical protein